MYYVWEQSAAKKGTWLLWTAHVKQKRKCSATLTVVGWNDNMAVYIASSDSSKPKRFVRRWKKVERKYIQEQWPLLQQKHGFCQQNGLERG